MNQPASGEPPKRQNRIGTKSQLAVREALAAHIVRQVRGWHAKLISDCAARIPAVRATIYPCAAVLNKLTSGQVNALELQGFRVNNGPLPDAHAQISQEDQFFGLTSSI